MAKYDYDKLAKDLLAAHNRGIEAAAALDDYGDDTAHRFGLMMPGAHNKKVLEAARGTGLQYIGSCLGEHAFHAQHGEWKHAKRRIYTRAAGAYMRSQGYQTTFSYSPGSIPIPMDEGEKL